jgi:tetratricopeptide (TPR) repeat protein
MREAVAQARSLAHPFTLAWVLDSAAELRWQLGQTSAALELWKEQVGLCIDQGFKNLWALASLRIGFAEVQEGKDGDGLSRMREGLFGLMDSIDKLQGVGILALAEGKAGQIDKGLARIDDALMLVKKSPTFWLTIRLNVIKGQLLLMKSPSALRKARQYFTRAIAIARSQKAKSEELAATIQLARVLNQQGRRDQARAMLKKIYNWFTEGFDTADLKEAKALLDELTG